MNKGFSLGDVVVIFNCII